MKGRKTRPATESNILRALIPAVLTGLALLLLSGCMIRPEEDLPPVTIDVVITAAPTEESGPAPTAVPTAAPQEETPISFSDINFENAVREAIGRTVGSIYPSDLKDIKSFTSRVSGIVNIKEIVYFTSLEELDLMGNRIGDLTPLTALRNLKKLNIAKNFTVMTGDREKGLDISPLGSLPLLEYLDASNNLITDVSALGSLNMLRWLDVQTNRLKDLNGLEDLTSLEYLNISNSFHSDKNNDPAGITDISALSGMVNLKTLYMQNGRVSSIAPLTTLTKLEYVDASYNSVRIIPNMSRMSSLKTLILRANFIYGLEGLISHPSLTLLDVRDNFVSVINVILTMPKLEAVYLDGNPVVNYGPLDVFEALKNGTYVPPLPVKPPSGPGTEGTT